MGLMTGRPGDTEIVQWDNWSEELVLDIPD